jgi:hypothetical protein
MGDEAASGWGASLSNEELTDVWFVRDYVMLGFDRTMITCVGVLRIVVDDATFEFPGAGSRDSLCDCIGSSVASARSWPDDSLEIQFDNGSKISVTPDPSHPDWEVTLADNRPMTVNRNTTVLARKSEGWAQVLLGEECAAVWFVRDYVRIQLHRYYVTCTGLIRVSVAGTSYVYPERGSRDALCQLINRLVLRAIGKADGSLDLEFDGAISVSVTPDPEHREWNVTYVEES